MIQNEQQLVTTKNMKRLHNFSYNFENSATLKPIVDTCREYGDLYLFGKREQLFHLTEGKPKEDLNLTGLILIKREKLNSINILLKGLEEMGFVTIKFKNDKVFSVVKIEIPQKDSKQKMILVLKIFKNNFKLYSIDKSNLSVLDKYLAHCEKCHISGNTITLTGALYTSPDVKVITDHITRPIDLAFKITNCDYDFKRLINICFDVCVIYIRRNKFLKIYTFLSNMHYLDSFKQLGVIQLLKEDFNRS